MRLALSALLAFAASTVLAAADGVVLAIPAKGAPAFTVTAPAGWSAVGGDGGVTTLLTTKRNPHIQVWQVAEPTIDAAEARLAALIASEVKDFAAKQRTAGSVAGAPAVVLVGTGTEADDGDPANAQATLFSVGGKVWLLLSHAEGSGAADSAKEVAALLASLAAKP